MTVPLGRRLLQAGGSGLDLDHVLVQALIAIQPWRRRFPEEPDSHQARAIAPASVTEGQNGLQKAIQAEAPSPTWSAPRPRALVAQTERLR
ncbi:MULTISPECIES: hypothetical protein [unclassified Streptomyces]|uniref:hypothetical protein n=1 Tax=Streptomyces sp. NBC_01187 TaxID=2903766 RepID=UPI002DD87EC9|nr:MULTISPECIES: hypothetical protein [unclassified Streptomyces]WSS46782.1 hypothetical protein OG220_40130 [Streptomyces sp. NBC_01187]WSA97699.1 hypothetical protein OIE63_40080 [Streptomyces sp. NBC_01795]WSB82050.1 hypothetical protein OHB04_40730 [Streptomyces sp. NBC_01775]WSS18023.1 hypothetical protein OG533_39810 [Streptomyces sp. NBC_01186]WSS47001.1 hypothetical protein OG220_41495 [Streptomyces sp. NBC_01187]